MDLQSFFVRAPVTPLASSVLVATAAIVAAGTAMTPMADRLADATGFGEAIVGAVLLGASTSLPGSVASVWAGYNGYAGLAVGNRLGGIAVQTVFLAIADAAHPRANLEHAAASLENLLQGALLATLLGIVMVAMAGPQVSVLGVSPFTVVLLGAYVYGLRIIRVSRGAPAWEPARTSATELDEPDEAPGSREAVSGLVIRVLALAVIAGAAGFVVAEAGIASVERSGLDQTVVGMLGTAVATSLPELVTSVAAVRRGALTLAVGGIIGGNCCDVLFLAFSDIAYREGSIYHAVAGQELLLVALGQVLIGILLLGLLRRQRTGVANLGFESPLMMGVYLVGVALIVRA